jgi:hypothetical protein
VLFDGIRLFFSPSKPIGLLIQKPGKNARAKEGEPIEARVNKISHGRFKQARKQNPWKNIQKQKKPQIPKRRSGKARKCCSCTRLCCITLGEAGPESSRALSAGGLVLVPRHLSNKLVLRGETIELAGSAEAPAPEVSGSEDGRSSLASPLTADLGPRSLSINVGRRGDSAALAASFSLRRLEGEAGSSSASAAFSVLSLLPPPLALSRSRSVACDKSPLARAWLVGWLDGWIRLGLVAGIWPQTSQKRVSTGLKVTKNDRNFTGKSHYRYLNIHRQKNKSNAQHWLLW